MSENDQLIGTMLSRNSILSNHLLFVNFAVRLPISEPYSQSDTALAANIFRGVDAPSPGMPNWFEQFEIAEEEAAESPVQKLVALPTRHDATLDKIIAECSQFGIIIHASPRLLPECFEMGPQIV